jgi:hypothetical protein
LLFEVQAGVDLLDDRLPLNCSDRPLGQSAVQFREHLVLGVLARPNRFDRLVDQRLNPDIASAR